MKIKRILECWHIHKYINSKLTIETLKLFIVSVSMCRSRYEADFALSFRNMLCLLQSQSSNFFIDDFIWLLTMYVQNSRVLELLKYIHKIITRSFLYFLLLQILYLQSQIRWQITNMKGKTCIGIPQCKFFLSYLLFVI
jgi:hypothetical protein